MRFPLLARAAVVAGVAVVLLVPLQLVNGKIAERQARAHAVERSFAAETSGPQTVVGPLLALTCEERYVEEREIKRGGKAETVAESRLRACPTGYFAPRALAIAGTMPVETRHRGIYPIRLYRAALELSGALYVLLRSEDYALLGGSILVFGVLAAAMVLTRRLDWSALGRRLGAPAAA